ncbi:hypothetical protein ACHAPA_006635 [Fusarium lateritium]
MSRDDGVAFHVQASDLMYNWNFARFDGRDHYHVATSEDRAAGEKSELPKDQQKELAELNRYCRLRDVSRRRLKAERLSAFSNCWLTVTRAKKTSDISSAVDLLIEEIESLTKTIKDLDQVIKIKSGDDPKHPEEVKEFERGANPPFAQRRDPTLPVGGVRSGWESNYLLALLDRLNCRIIKPDFEKVDASWDALFKDVIDDRLPSWMQQYTQNLLREFIFLRSRRQPTDNGHPDEPNQLAERGLIRGSVHPLGELRETVVRPPPQSETPLFHDLLTKDVNGENVWHQD